MHFFALFSMDALRWPPDNTVKGKRKQMINQIQSSSSATDDQACYSAKEEITNVFLVHYRLRKEFRYADCGLSCPNGDRQLRISPQVYEVRRAIVPRSANGFRFLYHYTQRH